MLSEAEIMKQPAKPDVLFGRICSSNQLSCTCAICKHRLLARTPAKRNIVNCENPPSGGMVIVKLVSGNITLVQGKQTVVGAGTGS